MNESFYFPPDNEHTFSTSHFHGKPRLDVALIDERIKSTSLEIDRREMNNHHNNMKKRKQLLPKENNCIGK